MHRDVHEVLKAQYSKLKAGSAEVAIATSWSLKEVSKRNLGIGKLGSDVELYHIDAWQRALQPERLSSSTEYCSIDSVLALALAELNPLHRQGASERLLTATSSSLAWSKVSGLWI